MGEPEKAENIAGGPPKRKWGQFFLFVVLPLLLFASLCGFARYRVETTDWQMHEAVRTRNLSRVRWLVRFKPSLARAKADWDAQGHPMFDEFRNHPVLFSAVENDDAEMIEFLVSKGADLKATDNGGHSALSAAARYHRPQATETLLRSGAPIGPEDVCSAALLDSKRLELLLNRGGDSNSRNRAGDPAICAAAHYGPSEAIGILLAHGADPNASTTTEPSPIVMAAYFGHEDAVMDLLAHGADPNVRDQLGATALSMAAREGDVPMVKLLLAHAAAPNIMERQGATALSRATMEGAEAVVEVLLKNGADPNADPRTLSIAKGLSPPRPKIVEMLIAHGAK